MRTLGTAEGWTFYQHESFYSTPACELLARYNAEMYEREFNDSVQHGVSHVPVIWAERAGTAAAFIGYTFHGEGALLAHIASAWVDPAHRHAHTGGRALYDLLFEQAARWLQAEHGIRRIQSGTHCNNVAAQRAFARQGRTLVGLMYVYDIPAPVEPTEPVPQPNLLQRTWRWWERRCWGV